MPAVLLQRDHRLRRRIVRQVREAQSRGAFTVKRPYDERRSRSAEHDERASLLRVAHAAMSR
eukprot:5645208-Prymnesium_polylepis.1